MNSIHALNSPLALEIVVTLVVVLLIGIPIGFVAVLGNRCLRQSTALIRYRWNLAAFGLLIVSIPVTFLGVRRPMLSVQTRSAWSHAINGVELAKVEAENREGEKSTPPTEVNLTGELARAAVPEPSSVDAFGARTIWRVVAPWIAAGYVMGVLTMLVRLGFGLASGARLRPRGDSSVDPKLLAVIRDQARALGMRCAPAIGYSERVAVPAVVGLLRPMIVLPMTMAVGLTPDQLQAVLCHELAHIRRGDHVILVLQRIGEALLFFHPAAWYITRQIHLERENCCDDLVLDMGNKRLVYAESLLRIAELRLGATEALTEVAALAADGHHPSCLRRRIARIVGEPIEPKVHWFRSSPLVVTSIAAILLLTFAMRGLAEPKPAARSSTEQPAAKANEEPAKTDSLANALEFGEPRLEMSHDEFKRTIVKKAVATHVQVEKEQTTYVLLTSKGDCVVVKFQGDKCSAIQRMQRVAPAPIAVQMAANNELTIDDRQFKTTQDLIAYLAEEYSEAARKERTLLLKIHPDTEVDRLNELIEAAKEIGLLKMHFTLLGVEGASKRDGNEPMPAEQVRVPEHWFIPTPFPEFGHAQVGEDYMNFVRIACHPRMMADAKLTEMQQAALTAILDELNDDLRKLNAGLDIDERRARAGELAASRRKLWSDARKLVDDTLTKKQKARVRQIEMQRHRHAIFFYPELAPELRLTPAQVAKLRKRLRVHLERSRSGEMEGQVSYRQYWSEIHQELTAEQRRTMLKIRGNPLGHEIENKE